MGYALLMFAFMFFYLFVLYLVIIISEYLVILVSLEFLTEKRFRNIVRLCKDFSVN